MESKARVTGIDLHGVSNLVDHLNGTNSVEDSGVIWNETTEKTEGKRLGFEISGLIELIGIVYVNVNLTMAAYCYLCYAIISDWKSNVCEGRVKKCVVSY